MMAVIDDTFPGKVLACLPVAPSLAYDALKQHLRAAFPGTPITVCGEDDIPARLQPVAESAIAQIYFVASGDHCLSLTNDAAAATGIVVALRGEDD